MSGRQSSRTVQDVWRDTLRDLQWRRRRFVVAVIGTALVFAVTLLIGGLAESFRAEARRSVESLGIDAWVSKAGTSGPFTGVSLIDAGVASTIARSPAVRRADPILVLPEAVEPSKFVSAQVFGFVPGGIGSPPTTEGTTVKRRGEAVVDDRLGPRVGDRIEIAKHPFTVVGLTHGLTLFGGQPNVYVAIGDLQVMSFNGVPLATAIGVHGRIAQAPPGLHAIDRKSTRLNSSHNA